MVRTETRKIKVGNIYIGGQNDLIIQSMTTYKTSDIKNIVDQINYLSSLGCQLIRVSVLDKEDALAIKEIKKYIKIPLCADIHYDSSLAILAIENGADKIRINPGNIPIDTLEKLTNLAKKRQICIRIGVNNGSIDSEFSSLPTYIGMFKSAEKYIKYFENHKFYNLVISVKCSYIDDFIKCNELIAYNYSYPIHIGLTEAGDTMSSIVSSSIALSKLIEEGIGDTIRVSINGEKKNEIIVAKEILKNCKIRNNIPTLIACPTCGRCKLDTSNIVNNIREYLNTINSDIKVAIMGCVVNGIGESKDADIGIAGGDDCAMLFIKGKIIKKIEYSQIESVLKEEIKKIVK